MNGLPGSYTGMDKFSLGGSFSTQLGHCYHHQDGVSRLFRKVQTDILQKNQHWKKVCRENLKTNTRRTF